MQQQGSFDVWNFREVRRGAVEWYTRVQFRQPCRKYVHHASAVAESHDAEFAVRARLLLQELCRGNEIFFGLSLIQLRENLARFVFVAGITAEGKQRVRRERDEV